MQGPVYHTMSDILAQSVDFLGVYLLADLPSTKLPDGFECDSKFACSLNVGTCEIAVGAATRKAERQRGDSNPCGQSPMDF